MANAATSSSALQAMVNSQDSSEPNQEINPLPAIGHDSHPAGSSLKSALLSPGLGTQSLETTDLIQDMTEALKALQASDEAHRAIIELINFTAKPMVIQAMFASDAAESAGYVTEIKKILDQITNIAEDSANAYLDYSTAR